jgi:hypothetical protein
VGGRYNPETGDVVVGRITEVGMSHNCLMNSASTNKGQQEQTFSCSLEIIVVFVVEIFSLCNSMDMKLVMIFSIVIPLSYFSVSELLQVFHRLHQSDGRWM